MKKMIAVKLASFLLILIMSVVPTWSIPLVESLQKYGQAMTLDATIKPRETMCKQLIKTHEKKGALLLSNSPECVQETGVLYRAVTEGKGRLIFHHLNAFTKDKKVKLVVRLINPSNEMIEVTCPKQVIKGPCADVVYTGQQLIEEYFRKEDEKHIQDFSWLKNIINPQVDFKDTLEPYETKVIYETAGDEWRSQQVLSGMIDFELSHEALWEVVVLDAAVQSTREVYNFAKKDGHPRGTYNTLEETYKVRYDGTNVTHFVIGEQKEEWQEGYDEITGEAVYNKGNFGLLYHIRIKVDQDTTLLINPRGNLFKGAVKLGENPTVTVPTEGELNGGNQVAIIGTMKAGQTKVLHYMLPNGSSAPVLFLLVPNHDGNVENTNNL